MGWKFDLGDTTVITVSGEAGSITGRAEYEASERQYLVRYVTADGRATEQWWAESALSRQVSA